MKKLLYYLSATVAIALGAISCRKEPLPDNGEDVRIVPEVTANLKATATARTITLSWDPIEGAASYTYLFGSISGKVVKPELKFSALSPATEYGLIVEAVNSNGVAIGRFEDKVSTMEAIKLAAPQAREVSRSAGAVVMEWDAVENAESYGYNVVSDLNDTLARGTTQGTSLLYYMPVDAAHCTVNICAQHFSTDFYENSEWGSVTVNYGRTLLESVEAAFYIYRNRPGTIDFDFVSKTPTMLEKYDDGSFAARAFFGVEGCDYEFGVNREDGTVNILNAVRQKGEWFYIESGVEGFDPLVANPFPYDEDGRSYLSVFYTENDPDFGSYLTTHFRCYRSESETSYDYYYTTIREVQPVVEQPEDPDGPGEGDGGVDMRPRMPLYRML